MIDYSPFGETLEKSTENWYTLTNKHHLSHSTLHRLKHATTIQEWYILLSLPKSSMIIFLFLRL